jgi:hypothetical protein
VFRPAGGAHPPGQRSGLSPSHPPGETLSAYVDGELEHDVRAEVDAHLRACDICRQKVSQFRGDSDLFRRVPVQRVPMSLRRDLYRRLEDHERQRRVFPWGIPFPSANALALGITGILLVVMTPQLLGIWSVISGNTDLTSMRAASQEMAIPAEVLPEGEPSQAVSPATPATPVPSSIPETPATPVTAAQPSPTKAPVPTLAPTQVTGAAASGPSAGAPPAASPTAAVPSAPAGQQSAPGAGTESGASKAVQALPSPPAATPSAPPVSMRSISGQVAGVDRRQRLLTLQASASGAEAGARPVTVQLSEGTLITALDGRPLRAEDVGFADLVEVSGFELAAGPLMAARVKVTQSAVVQVSVRPKVLVLLDGAPSLRAPQFHFTGDWIKRLQDTGYDVTAVDPSSIAGGSAELKEFSLIAVGYPATLSDALIRTIRASRLPILNADPRLVQTFGLGLNADPAQPAKNIAGRTVDISPSAGPVTRGFSGETIVGGELYRMPIIANGTILATVVDGTQSRAVWSLTGNVMYFGFWYSANGQNHNATYWTLFDRSILLLLGKDPLVSPTPTGSR